MTLLSELCRRHNIDARVISEIKNDIDVESYLNALHRSADEESAAFKRSALARTGLFVRGYNKVDATPAIVDGTSFGYDENIFVADLLAPVIPGGPARQFPKYSRRNGTAIMNTEIGSDGEISEGSPGWSLITYKEKGQGHKVKVDLNAVAQSGLDLLEESASEVRSVLGNSRELRVANLFMSAANYGTAFKKALSGTARWDVGVGTSTADPLADIRAAKAACATPANTLVASTIVLDTLRQHPKISAPAGSKPSDRIASIDELAKLLGIDMIIEAPAKMDNAGSSSTPSYQYIWGKGLWVGTVTAGAGKRQKCFAKTVRHTPVTYKEELIVGKGVSGVTYLIGTHEDAEVITMDDAGYLIDTVIS